MARWSSQTTHTDISDFSDNPHLKRELQFWRLKIAAVVLTVLAVVGFSVKPVYRSFRESRINKNLDEAREAARVEDWATARDRARSVLLARQGDFEAYRIWTRAIGKMGEPRTYLAAATLFSDDRATEEDELECLKVMAQQAPQAVALSAFASLSPTQRNQADFRAAISPVFVLRGLIDVGEKGLRECMGERPGAAVRLELIRFLCARPTPDRVAEARSLFSGLLSERSDEAALAALELLGDAPGGLAPEAPLPDSLPEWVRSSPKAKTLHHLLALHPEIERTRPDNDACFAGAIERFAVTDPGTLGTWLIRHDRWQQALELLGEPALSRSDAYIAKLHALLIQGDDTALSKALAEPPPSADMMEVEVVAAVVAQKKGDLARSGAAWTRALNHAGFDTSRNRFIEVADFARLHHAEDALEDAWVGAIRSGWGRLPLYADLVDVFGKLASQGRSEDLLAMCRTLIRFEPHNPDLVNNFNYLGLIHGILPPDQTVDRMLELIARYPDQPEFRSALMLAQMMSGKPEDALGQLPVLSGSKRIAPMMSKALEGTARILAGEDQAGTLLLKDVNWRRFMRQERIVFHDLLLKARIAGLPMPPIEDVEVDLDPESVPAWRKAVEQMEKDRSGDVLPALPPPVIPGADGIESELSPNPEPSGRSGN